MYTIEKPTRKHKKYKAVFKDGRRSIHFGDIRYQHYKDSTPLQLYSKMNHLDPKRRRLYYIRHGKATKYSAKYFSHKYLW